MEDKSKGYPADKLGWEKKHEKDGWFNIDGLVYRKTICVFIPESILPSTATVAEVAKYRRYSDLSDEDKELYDTDGLEDGWYMYFGDRSFESTRDGECLPVIKVEKRGRK
jgi:hypothetical protein